MSDAARHALYAVAEVTYGVTPETPSFFRVRHTGTTLAVTKESFQSEELAPDRQIKDFRHGNKQTGGDVSVELSYGTFDLFIQAALGGTWAAAAAPLTAATIAADAEGPGFVFSANNAPVVEAGDWIETEGFTTSANNGRFKVVSRTVGEIVVEDPDEVLVDEVEGDSVTITPLTSTLKAGTERRSFSLLRHFSDQLEADKPFHRFTGQEVSTFSMSVAPGAMVTGTFGLIGKAGTVEGTAPAGSTLGSPTTTKVFDSFRGVIKEGGTTIGIATEVTHSLDNGITPRFVIGSDTTIQPSIGRSNLTGQLTVYFENSTMLEKFLDETESSLEFSLEDKAGNEYLFSYPAIVYSGGQPDVSGEGPITLAMPFQAIYGSIAASNVVVKRTPAA